MDLSKIASFITLEPSQLFRAERFVEQGLKMYNSDEELTEAYLKENLHGVTLDYAMHVLDESSTSYMDVAIHNQGGKFSAPTAGVYGVSSRPEIKQKIKDKVLKRNELEKKQRKLNKEEIELDELYKGKHGQTDKQYADSRSSGGKMVSGDSKQSGAEYTHGRRVKAANPGMQPDVGGKTKPKSQGKMDKGTRADLQYRKANLMKKEDVEVEEGYKPLPKEKMARQANKAYGNEQRAAAAGDQKETNKQMQRRIAIQNPAGRKASLRKEEVVNEEDYDRMKDRQLERGTWRPRSKPGVARSGGSQPGKKPSSGMSAFDKVAGDLKKKYGEKAIYVKKTTKEEVEELDEKKMSKAAHKKAAKAGKRWQDSDGDGKWYEPGQDVKKEEVVNLSDSLSSIVEGKAKCKECKGSGCGHCKGKGYMVTHNCSSKVEHAEWGSGECIKEMHTLDENGRISHYDVLFAHGIEENVSVHDLTTLVSEMHEHAINDEKNEVVESMKQARKNVGASKCWKGYKAQGTKTKDGKVVPNCVKEDEEIDEAMVEVKGKKKGNVIINPEVKKVNEDADVAKKQQVQRKQLMLNKQKLALQQKATTKKKPTDMHMEETEDIQEVDMSTRAVDYGQEIENTALKRKKEKKSLTDFKKLSKPKES